MKTKSYTLVIDLTQLPTEVVGTLIGAAKANDVHAIWPNNALLCAIDPAIGGHRAFEEGVRSAGLVTHRR